MTDAVTVVTRGDKETSLRLEQFPKGLQARLVKRIGLLDAALSARIQAAAPYKTGLLRSEVTPRLYTEVDRVAGYVSVYAGQGAKKSEYAKAGALEYGANKVRQARTMARAKITNHFARSFELRAYRYMRGPFDAMRGEIDAAFGEELAAAIAEAGGS